MKNKYSILEFDNSRESIVDPSKFVQPLLDIPERVIFCFFKEIVNNISKQTNVVLAGYLLGEMGKNPVYILFHNRKKIAITYSGVGAPLAAAYLESVIAWGGKKIIGCGSAGLLDDNLDKSNIFIPKSAIRDEGTSYHYISPAREIVAHPKVIGAIETTLKQNDIPYTLCKTWTTDAIFRETKKKIIMRKAEGCKVVEMEISALLSVAQFRKVLYGQILYVSDDVSREKWKDALWSKETISPRELTYRLALDILENI